MGNRAVRIGNAGDDVKELQTALLELKLYDGEVDGKFGTKTGRALIAFQNSRGLVADGVAGPKTWAALQAGAKSSIVLAVQEKLQRAGFEPGEPDGILGEKTRAALIAFQESVEKLEPSGAIDAETLAALDQALKTLDGEDAPSSEPETCSASTWEEFRSLVALMTSTPVRYGPGRGLFLGGKFVVTHGPGALGLKNWKTHREDSYPSFHCTSWVNFFLGWLLKYDGDYTHAGNVPSVFDLLESSRALHTQPNASAFRGYAPHARPIVSDGTSTKRLKMAKAVDIRELYARRASLPSFVVCGQSSRQKAGGWKWWHHVVLFAVDHRAPGHPLYRIAADGHKDAEGYSGNAMRWIEITKDSAPMFASAAYLAYGIYDVGEGPRAQVVLEP